MKQTRLTVKKIPFLDLFIVRGKELHRHQISDAIRDKQIHRLLEKNLWLRGRLKRWTG